MSSTPQIPKIGATYAPPDGCDTPLPTLVCESMRVGECQTDNVHCWRTVTLTYKETSQPGINLPRPFPHINSSEDPVTWKPEISIRKTPRQQVKESAFFLGIHREGSTTLTSVSNGVVEMIKDTVQPIMSTAGEPFNPPLYDETYDAVIVIKTYQEFWNPNNLYNAYDGVAVNDTDVRIKIDEWNFNRVYPKHTLKMGPISGDPVYKEWRDSAGTKHSRTFWPTTYEIRVRNKGWYVDALNVGRRRSYYDAAGVPDGRGGTIAAADFPAGSPPTGPIVDINGMPIDSPIDLDGAGEPLQAREARWVLRYIDGELKNFNDPNLGLPVATV